MVKDKKKPGSGNMKLFSENRERNFSQFRLLISLFHGFFTGH